MRASARVAQLAYLVLLDTADLAGASGHAGAVCSSRCTQLADSDVGRGGAGAGRGVAAIEHNIKHRTEQKTDYRMEN